jgi:hypothetical protein
LYLSSHQRQIKPFVAMIVVAKRQKEKKEKDYTGKNAKDYWHYQGFSRGHPP